MSGKHRKSRRRRARRKKRSSPPAASRVRAPAAPRSEVATRTVLDFVGIGAARCGTSWLTRCLAEHPAVFIPDGKELRYFDDDFLYEPTLRRLRPHFVEAGPDRVRGVFSPHFMTSRVSLERIAASCPDVRVIVCLRHPVDRMFSEFCYFRYNLKREPNTDFLAALEGPSGPGYFERSLYATQLELVQQLFPKRCVHIVLYDDITRRPLQLLGELFGFLRIDRDFEPPSARQRINRSNDSRYHAPRAAWAWFGQRVSLGGNRLTRLVRPLVLPAFDACNRLVDAFPILQSSGDRPRLDPVVRRELCETYFREDLDRTERLTGLDLSAWKPRAEARRKRA